MDITKLITEKSRETFKGQIDTLLKLDNHQIKEFLGHFSIEEVVSKLDFYPIFNFFYKKAKRTDIVDEAHQWVDFLIIQIKTNRICVKRPRMDVNTLPYHHRLEFSNWYDPLMEISAFIYWKRNSMKEENSGTSKINDRSHYQHGVRREFNVQRIEVDAIPSCSRCAKSSNILYLCSLCSMNPFCDGCSRRMHAREDREDHIRRPVKYEVKRTQPDRHNNGQSPNFQIDRRDNGPSSRIHSNRYFRKVLEDREMPSGEKERIFRLLEEFHEIKEPTPFYREALVIMRVYYQLDMKTMNDFRELRRKFGEELQRRNGVGQETLSDVSVIMKIFELYPEETSVNELFDKLFSTFNDEFNKFLGRVERSNSGKKISPKMTSTLKSFFYSEKKIMFYRKKFVKQLEFKPVDIGTRLENPERLCRMLLVEFEMSSTDSAQLLVELLKESQLPSYQIIKLVKEEMTKRICLNRQDLEGKIKCLGDRLRNGYDKFSEKKRDFETKMKEVCHQCYQHCHQNNMCYGCQLKTEVRNGVCCDRIAKMNRSGHVVLEAVLKTEMVPKSYEFCQFPITKGPFTFICGDQTYYESLCRDHFDLQSRLRAQSIINELPADAKVDINHGFPPVDNAAEMMIKFDSIKQKETNGKCPISGYIHTDEVRPCVENREGCFCSEHLSLFIHQLSYKHLDDQQLRLYEDILQNLGKPTPLTSMGPASFNPLNLDSISMDGVTSRSPPRTNK